MNRSAISGDTVTFNLSNTGVLQRLYHQQQFLYCSKCSRTNFCFNASISTDLTVIDDASTSATILHLQQIHLKYHMEQEQHHQLTINLG